MPRRPLAILVPLLLALACSPEPRDRPIPSDSKTWRTNVEFQKSIEALPKPDRRLLEGWMMRHSFKAGMGESIPSLTISEAIEQQRTFEADRKNKKATEPKAEAKSAPAEPTP